MGKGRAVWVFWIGHSACSRRPEAPPSASSFDDVIGRTRRVTIDRSIAVERVGFTDVEPFFFLFFHARCLRAVRAFGG